MELQDFLSKLSLPQDFTRRGFLKATSVMAAIGMMNQARAASGVRPYIVLETAKGILICDPNLCVACHRCELACTEFNEGKADPRLARIKITRNVMFGHAGTNVYPPTKGIWGDGIVVQDTCRQCAHPTPCANACPQGAIVVDPKTGARRVDKEKCIGCHLCEILNWPNSCLRPPAMPVPRAPAPRVPPWHPRRSPSPFRLRGQTPRGCRSSCG